MYIRLAHNLEETSGLPPGAVRYPPAQTKFGCIQLSGLDDIFLTKVTVRH